MKHLTSVIIVISLLQTGCYETRAHENRLRSTKQLRLYNIAQTTHSYQLDTIEVRE